MKTVDSIYVSSCSYIYKHNCKNLLFITFCNVFRIIHQRGAKGRLLIRLFSRTDYRKRLQTSTLAANVPSEECFHT